MANTESMLEMKVGGVPVIMTEFGYKTFSMVVKAIGYFTHRTSPTYLRTSGVMETRYGGQSKVSSHYPKDSADYIMDLYENNGINDIETIVISPGLEISCYIGRALNAPVLPSQFIASATNRGFVEKGNNQSNIYIVGHEADWPKLCVWIKPKDLGELYSRMIDRVKNVVIFSKDSGPQNKLGTYRGWFKDNIHILDGFTGDKNFRERIQKPGENGYSELHDKIPHWEFSMEYEQIVNLKAYCKTRGIKTVTISTGDWRGFIPAELFKRLFKKNNFRPTGITYHNYWACHPFYEAEFLRVPVQNFQYGADVYVEEFRKFIESVDWESKNGEYLTWNPLLNKTAAVNPTARFESWGFPTVYRTDRAYDVWCFGWNHEFDLHNPTREWIVPKLQGKKTFRNFHFFLSIDELIDIARNTRKTNVAVS